MGIESGFTSYMADEDASQAGRWFSEMIQPGQLVGDLYSMNYESARVLIHDHYKHQVNGIPSLCFLIACRADINEAIDYKLEDSSVILLRVLDSAPLPNSAEAERVRVETAQRVSGEAGKHWDSSEVMDIKTRDYLSYAAIECRIIGTFFLDKQANGDGLAWQFGCDISNYYPNRGLKVYKPSGKALERIVNYIKPDSVADHEKEYGKTALVRVGKVRYASTNRKYQDVDEVPVFLHPVDLLAQKTALFGMTRTGKSNTTKIIAKAVYNLRNPHSADYPTRIGQIIFDPNGEYANENTQDGTADNPNALKNVWTSLPDAQKDSEVVTYGLEFKDDDPDRNIMKINFYDDQFLQLGKELINALFEGDGSKYIKAFMLVKFDDAPDSVDRSASTRYKRKALVYRTLLKKAGFALPSNYRVVNDKLFNAKLLDAMETLTLSDSDKQTKIRSAATLLRSASPSLDSLAQAFEGLFIFLGTPAYGTFNAEYEKTSSTGEAWADTELRSLLELFMYPKTISLISKCMDQHNPDSKNDYAIEIYNDLKAGKLVIVDQSTGDPDLNAEVARRIMWQIFNGNLGVFRTGEPPKDILVYAEEAHNLLPAGNNMDNKDVWVRTAKEGAKFKIGLIYATQEVSSIHKNILKNTSNWFISHLNNTDETKELCKFYDFADFEASIRKAQDKGFLRVKTLSNYFVIPVQVDKFEIR